MSKTASSLGLRLFLEGVEVPVIAAQVHLQPSTPATATIQVVPTDAALSFLPRTLVHLFYLDDQATRSDAEAPNTTAIQRPSVNRIDVPDEQYKLLFTGEVIGYNFQKTPINRAMILQCMDLSSYWDTCYQWFEDWSVGGNALTDRSYAFVGGGTGLFDNVAGDPKSVIAEILKSAPKNPAYRKTRGLLGGMISLLETIGGIRPDKGDFAGYRGVNDFFSIAELRYKLTAQIGALESDKTSAQIYSSKAFISWLKKGISSLGTLVSFRQIIGHVSRYVFHDIYPNPAAYYVPSEVEEVWVKTTRKTKIQEEDNTTRDKLKQVLVQLQTARRRLEKGTAEEAGVGVAGRNKIAVDSIEPTLGKIVVKTEEPRIVGDDAALASLAAFPKFLNKARKLIAEVVATPGLDAATKSRLETAYLQLEDAYLKGGEPKWAGRGTTNVNVQKIVANAAVIDRRISRAYQIIQSLLKIKASKEVVKANTPGSYKRRIERGGHLFTQLILPETFFLPPPRCNVLFPDQYTQFTFSRNFMQEVTRLSCSGGLGVLISGDANSRRILGSMYFAPNIKAHKGGSLVGNYWRGGKVILPHEIHSGIIPKMEYVQGGHRWGAKAAKEKGVKNVPYIQRLANFQFFMNRWAARTISLTAAFNPRLVLGLSALVVDRSSPAPAALKEIEEALNRSVLPTQYLGKIASLSHDVNQSGGQTQVMMSHCRTHRGLDDEFVGILDRNVYDGNKVSITVKEMFSSSANTVGRDDKKMRLMREISQKLSLKSVTRVVAGMSVNEGGEDTLVSGGDPPAGASMAVEETGKEFAAKGLIKTYFKGYGTITKIEFTGMQKLTHDQVLSMSVEPEGLDATLLVGQESTVNPNYYFPEKITVTYTFRTGDITRSQRPIEELIMPGWYDSSWHTENIGEGDPDKGKPGAYLSLLGCGAITDDTESTEFTQAALYYGDFQYTGPAIEKSVDGLSILYGVIKDAGHDVHEFIRNYTDRPIANLVEILGSADYDPDAGTGTEGFHSNAFGDYNAGVVFNTGSPPTPDPDTGKRRPQAHLVPAGASIPRRSWRKKRLPEIPKYLDPRGRARLRVKAYMEELSLSRGLKG